MGQILSTRPDLIPVEFIRELEKLQDDVPPFPFSQVKEIVAGMKNYTSRHQLLYFMCYISYRQRGDNFPILCTY